MSTFDIILTTRDYRRIQRICCSDLLEIYTIRFTGWRSQWPRVLRRRSAAARLLRLWVRIPPGVWTFVCCECCVLSGRGLCDELTPRPEESYRLCCVVECDLENSWMRGPWSTGGCCDKKKEKKFSQSASKCTQFHVPSVLCLVTWSIVINSRFYRFQISYTVIESLQWIGYWWRYRLLVKIFFW
jgi:hypothetical protein